MAVDAILLRGGCFRFVQMIGEIISGGCKVKILIDQDFFEGKFKLGGPPNIIESEDNFGIFIGLVVFVIF